MSLLRMIFVWWRGATLGTMVNTWFRGRLVGRDNFGNRYYQDRAGKRRWVLYNGTVDASRVPAEWHGWLHHTFREPPTVAPPRIKSWEKEHVPNLTGTSLAYRPAGSLAATGQHAPATGEYEAWKPDQAPSR
ncbi:MAG TPA: NADH:ubiquinone oxidoreductase subunit NDUFA12 [Rhizomicrobium sp.]|jgi:NADH:ubiquinone oxidoreductase subunit